MGDNRPYIAVRTYADLCRLLREERDGAARARNGDRAIRLNNAMAEVLGAFPHNLDQDLLSLPEDDGSW